MRTITGFAAALAVVLSTTTAATAADFAAQVHPILVKRCFACHSAATKQGGLSVETVEGLRQGGASGPAVEPGAAERSPLYRRAAGLDEPRMPLGMAPLPPSEVEVLRDWINEGARWEGAADGPLRSTARLAPRPVEPPAGVASNPIDRFVERYWSERGVAPPEAVSDAVFIRRAYLDLWGFTPPADAVERYAADAAADKRARLIDRLLADDKLYAGHWISFWNDLLRNDEGVVYHGGRESITDWLLAALRANKPYDRMVGELLNPTGEGAPEGFLIGVNWRGTVNASQTPPMQAAQNSAQVFLGVNLKCASCHDSFINQWKLADSYGLASFFSEERLELVRCDAPTGRRAEIRFLFPELGGVEPTAPLGERRAAAARLFTSQANGRFARTMVNRYWKRLFGRGLVEPPDDLDQPPWDADLLDWLAADFVENGYDLKRLLRGITSSRAYALTAIPEDADQEGEYVFRGPFERRMSAEQFADSVSAITGEWAIRETGTSAEWARDWRIKASPLARVLGRPVRDQVFTERNEKATTLQALELLNGETLTKRLRRGAQRLLGRLPEAPEALWDSGFTRAEVREFDVEVAGRDELWLLIEDADSYDASRVVAGWADAKLSANGEQFAPPVDDAWIKPITFRPASKGAEPIAHADAVVGSLPMRLTIPLEGRYERFRGQAGVSVESLASDIGPRVRFFVFGERPNFDRLTTPRGGSPIGAASPPLPAEPTPAVEQIYRRVLGRAPSGEERAVALALLRPRDGEIPTEGLEDVLWSLFLLPEFQIIR